MRQGRGELRAFSSPLQAENVASGNTSGPFRIHPQGFSDKAVFCNLVPCGPAVCAARLLQKIQLCKVGCRHAKRFGIPLGKADGDTLAAMQKWISTPIGWGERELLKISVEGKPRLGLSKKGAAPFRLRSAKAEGKNPAERKKTPGVESWIFCLQRRLRSLAKLQKPLVPDARNLQVTAYKYEQ